MRMCILICDDSLFMRRLLFKLLKETYKNNIKIIEAENGFDAVSKYKAYQPDIVTMDITMPGMDGLEAIRKIKSIDPDVKVAVVSSMNQKHHVFEAINLGAMDYLIKPFFDKARIKEMVDKLSS